MRAAPTIAGLALVLGGLSGCGGGDGDGSSAPDDASKEDFCEAFNGFYEKVVSQVTEGDSANMIKALKEWAADIEEVGTPEGMPDDVRNGFELFVDKAQSLDDDATLDDLTRLGDDLSEGDQADGNAFSTWTTENCPAPELPTGLPTDLPTDLPSDLPTEVPSDLASQLEDLPTDLPTDPSELASLLSELAESAGS